MSIAAPATFTITGGATLTINVTGGSTIATATMSINGHTYLLSDVWDQAERVTEDLIVAASISEAVALKLLDALQFIVEMYFLKAATGSITSLPFSIALA